MHIPDGYLSPATYATLDAAMVPIWLTAGAKVRATLRSKQVPLLALAAAFSFVIMMFNVPVVGGSTGHAVGATLVAVILGPWPAVIAVSIAVVVQALVFGDGGITSLGANLLNMAVIMPFVGYYLYRLVSGDRPTSRRRIVAAGIGSYVAIVVSSIATGIEFGIQPLIAHTTAGQPLYAPYPLSVAVPAMALEHLLFFGPLEAAVTMGIVAVLARQDAALLEMRPAARPLRWLWAGLALVAMLTPIGILAGGTAWGEWSAAELRHNLGYVPSGLARLGDVWKAAIPGYAPAFIRNPFVGYLVAAFIGAAIVVGVAWLAARLLAHRERSAAAAPARRARRSVARRTADAVAAAVGELLDNERIAGGPGLLQSLDPRVKLVSIVLVAVTASFIHSVWLLAALVVTTMLLARASGIGVASFSAKVWSSAGLFGLVLAAPAATALFTPGTVVVPLGPASVTSAGLLVAARLIARVVAGAGFGLLVMWTTRWADMLRALTAMGVPDLVTATLAMTQKQIVSLLHTVENMHLARESRMLTAGSAGHDRRWVVDRMAFVAQRSIRTADDVYDAMLARGFDGRMPSLVALEMRAADWNWTAATMALCALALIADKVVLPS